MNKKPAQPTVGSIRHLIEKSGLTYAAFATLVHASTDAVQSWASGRRNMPASTYHYAKLRVADLRKNKGK